MPENRDPAIHWLLFDIGGVLITRPDDIGAISRALDPDAPGGEEAEARVRDAFDAHREQYDRGGSAREFWEAVARDLDLPTPGEDDLAELVAIEQRRWGAPDDETLAALDRAVAAGYRLAVLSNAPHELADVLEDRDGWGARFDHVMTSARIGMAKPDADVWPLAAERLGSPAERILFVDDKPDNVEAARRAGFHAHVWEGLGTLDRILAGELA
ncbi:HAD family phosphatase [Clavibacter tessellarius]|uniref:Haloacid dehalogenase n=1 Tax=Clavibacter tessellarius TaxID=31965 RepID=A0A225CJX8_9MICO|nr:HAD family phosphatase [Clavibacter michiganensis]OQJ62713.1 haloacid dehalogenase [Clavibacter michiganensis subsp. tessellarius]UKF34300.1 HAD family phosphatase [Clavibacter michiganensis subsp. tessellarius]